MRTLIIHQGHYISNLTASPKAGMNIYLDKYNFKHMYTGLHCCACLPRLFMRKRSVGMTIARTGSPNQRSRAE